MAFETCRVLFAPSLRLLVGVAAALALVCPAWGETIEGYTEPIRKIDLAASEMAVVAKIHVKEGDEVRAGQLIAELDTEVLEAQLEMALARAKSQGALEAARAEYDLRRHWLEKYRELARQGNATEGELTRAEADCQIALARLNMAKEEQAISALECRRIEAQIERRRLRTPISGIVSKVHREVGEATLPHEPKVITIVQLDQLRARFHASPEEAAKLNEGQPVMLSLPDLNQTAPGTIERISPLMDKASGTVEVTAVVENPQHGVRSGARCLLHPGRQIAERNSDLRTRQVKSPRD